MNCVMVECKNCKTHFMTVLKIGKVTCPECGNTDNICEIYEYEKVDRILNRINGASVMTSELADDIESVCRDNANSNAEEFADEFEV
jgi:uncharacterized Zn finger protein (UPF0148 family)